MVDWFIIFIEASDYFFLHFVMITFIRQYKVCYTDVPILTVVKKFVSLLLKIEKIDTNDQIKE